MKFKQKPFYLLMVLALLAGMIGFQPAQSAEAGTQSLRISQLYAGGGGSTGIYMYDAIELFNTSDTAIDLTGMSLQYQSATGTTWSNRFNLSGTIQAKSYFLIRSGSAGSGGTEFPVTHDLIGTLNLSGSTGKLALVNGTDQLPNGCPASGTVLDLIGYGDANCSETAPIGSATTQQAFLRNGDGCTDEDNNSTDFTVGTPTLRNSVSPINNCGPTFFPERLIISEYVEGSSDNNAIELYNGTGVDLDLQDYYVSLYSNGSITPTTVLSWTEETTLFAGDTYVVVNSAASDTLKAYADTIHGITAFSGNDTLVLFDNTSGEPIVRDSFGQRGVDPGSGWGSGDTYTVDHTLVRKANICSGDTVPDDAFDPALEYDGYTIDTFTNLGSHTMTCGPADQAPTVASTVPADGANNVAVDANIVITFSEPVTVTDTDPWFTISCTESSTHTAAVTDADTVFTLDPDTDFVTGETCTVTVLAASVSDDDTEDPPDTMEANYVFSFDTVEACGDPFTPIYDIQGSVDISPLKGEIVTTQGVVTGDFQNNAAVDSGELNGFFIQDITGDSDPLTSDGIFAYYTPVDVKVGDTVRVTGTIAEYKGLTEIGTITQVLICDSGAATPDPISITMPIESSTWLERYEGVLVTFPDTLTIAEYFNYDRYGNIVLTKGRFSTFTAANEPNIDNFAADNLAFKNNSIKLDDGISSQNPATLRHPDGTAFTKDHYFRGGDLLTGVTGFIDYYEDDYEANYRVQPTVGAQWTPVFSREIISELDLLPGDLKIASFNVLNYFVTLTDDGNICGPSGTMECRGADDAEEFTRQKAKIVAAMAAINADIFGLMEIENDSPISGNDAVADLVDGLNTVAGTDTYAYIDTGAIGTDAIKQAILYKPASVTPVGEYQILDSSVDARFIDTLNRPVLAQVFMDNKTGIEFVVAVNHLKSKGSACTGDPDLLDGQGNCNLTRKAAAEAMVDWLADPDYFPNSQKSLIIGDLNSYDKEDPIDMIKMGSDDVVDTTDDYLDMIFEFHGEYAYGYVFDGKFGYLDYALANMELAGNVVDVNFWHINADESDVFDYDMTFKPIEQEALYSVDPYRSSDHDPVIVTLAFNESPVAQDQEVTTGKNTSIEITLVATDADGDELTYAIVDQPTNGTVVLAGNKATYTPDNYYIGLDSFTFKANDGELDSNVATVSITVTDTDYYLYLPIILK